MGRKKLLNLEFVMVKLQQWIVEHSQPPSIAELRTALGVGSTRTVLRYLQALEEDGSIRRWAGARGIQILRQPPGVSEHAHTIAVPLIGEAPAGKLMLAEENLESWLRLPVEMVRPPTAKFFLLRVRGDSMNRAKVGGHAIDDGDLVVVRQQPTAEPGAIVVALVDGEATIKRLERGKNYVALVPISSNPDHHPIVLYEDFLVQGVVINVIKNASQLLP